MTIRGVPTTRVSDTFVRQRLLGQVQSDQLDLYRLQSQLSTGRRFDLPSQDPVASLRVIGLQSLLERKAQAQTNLATTQSYLTATDSAMSSISGLLTEARAAALSVSDTLSTDDQRAAVAQTVDQLTEQLIDVANTQFRGRYLFAGSTTQTRPYEALDGGGIEYCGNDKTLLSYTDVGFLSETNVPGPEVFGGVSETVHGANLGLELSHDTLLADFFGPGLPLDATGIQIVNGGNTYNVDFSADETVEDLLNTLNSSGAGVRAEINAAGTGFDIRSCVSGGDFAIGENGSETASQLGLRTLGGTTRLDDLNHGAGVPDADGTDFVIRRADGVEISVDVAGMGTIDDVLAAINGSAANTPVVPGGEPALVARLAAYGNGIELVDNSGPDTITVSRTFPSTAAAALGLMPGGEDSITSDPAAAGPPTLTGRDVATQEVGGVFSALLQLQEALVNNDLPGIERAVGMLDAAFQAVNFARAEVGARQQALDAVQTRLEDEDVQLRDMLSKDFDADLVEVISELTARQTAFEAALQSSAQILSMTLLDYL